MRQKATPKGVDKRRQKRSKLGRSELMAVRSVIWRRICPEKVANTFEDALKMTLYLVHQTGPTGFVLKEEREKSKIKVFLGDPHTCSCSSFKRNKELCVHLLWVLLKKFRIPRTNPVIWQLGLVEREINELVYEHLRCQSPSLPDPPTNLQPRSTLKTRIPPKEIGGDDVCPICQDDLIKCGKKLTYCRFSCGKSMHVKCMRIWSDHQKSMGEQIIRCPLCRQDFGSIISHTSSSSNSNSSGTVPPGGREKPHQHLGTSCSHCHVCPVVGKCYKCVTCPSYFLCHRCHASNHVHLLHSFMVRQHCSQPWRSVTRSYGTDSFHSHPPAPRPAQPELGGTLPPSFIRALQTRSLTEEDYEMLMNLDHHLLQDPPEAPPTWSQQVRQRERTIWLPTELLDSSHHVLVGGAICGMCQMQYSRGDWMATLPCKHQFHQDCITEWLAASQICCPFDNLPIKPHTQSRHAHQQPSSEVIPSWSRDEFHPMLQRRVKGGVNMPLTKATTGGREGNTDKLKFGVSGTKLAIRKGPCTEGIPSHPNPIPSGGTAMSPNHAHQACLATRKNVTVPTCMKMRKTHIDGTVEGRNIGIGGTGLSHGRKNVARTKEAARRPAQISAKIVHISTSKPRSS